jgi:DNA topoisomerase-6 subunit B
MDNATFNRYRTLVHAGVTSAEAVRKASDGVSRSGKKHAVDMPPSSRAEDTEEEAGPESGAAAAAKSKPKKEDVNYYRITCKDNGCGMPHDKIPDMLGRVLSGSKYGVRQTRGKFGLGAKMALIWSKKSTSLPIEVTSAFTGTSGPDPSSFISSALSVPPLRPPSTVSFCKLDIDIYKNEPHVLQHEHRDNLERMIGTEISVAISGTWSAYRARVMHYFQQLAVITPYAEFHLQYINLSSASSKSNFSYDWKRRSNQIPPQPLEVKHHPSAVNDLLVQQLIDHSKLRSPAMTLSTFLTTQFQGIDRALASEILGSVTDADVTQDTAISKLSTKSIHALRVAMETVEYPQPSGACLSPAGEYNLRLGIMKEIRPDLVATASSAVCVYQGHPFVVEAGVCLGGRGNEGLTVHRFANRIPLLFEGGADVATQTATRRMPWAAYKIDIARDKVGVFVSLVSTKIPFKGTGKEYIGDDITEIREAVKSALQSCCTQMRVKLLRASALRAKANRRKTLIKYIPDVTRALAASYKAVCARAGEKRSRSGAGVDDSAADQRRDAWISRFKRGEISDELISKQLHVAVERADLDAALDAASGAPTMLTWGSADTGVDGGGVRVFINPTSQSVFKKLPPVDIPGCVAKFLQLSSS